MCRLCDSFKDLYSYFIRLTDVHYVLNLNEEFWKTAFLQINSDVDQVYSLFIEKQSGQTCMSFSGNFAAVKT